MRKPFRPAPASFGQLHQACAVSLQQVLVTSQQVGQQMDGLQPPITSEQQKEFVRHWHLQFAAWNNYASAARRLGVFLRQQRQPFPD